MLEQNSPHSVDLKSNHGGDWHLGLVSRSRARAQAGGLAEAESGSDCEQGSTSFDRLSDRPTV